jgi:hypothetical protein
MGTKQCAEHPPAPAPGPRGRLATKNLGAAFFRFKGFGRGEIEKNFALLIKELRCLTAHLHPAGSAGGRDW